MKEQELKEQEETEEDDDGGCPYGYGCRVFGSIATRCGHLVDDCPYLKD